MRHRWARLLSGLIVAMLGLAAGVEAGEPTDQLRANIDELYRSIDPSAAPAGQGDASARAIVDRMFDWTAMAETALRSHWPKRTPAERAEFTRLFAALFARAYLSRINLVDATTFQYLGDTTVGDRSTVKTKVRTRRGNSIDVDYVVRGTPDAQRWHVQDVRVETISLVDHYRVQFDAIISRSSYDELVKRLRAAGP